MTVFLDRPENLYAAKSLEHNSRVGWPMWNNHHGQNIITDIELFGIDCFRTIKTSLSQIERFDQSKIYNCLLHCMQWKKMTLHFEDPIIFIWIVWMSLRFEKKESFCAPRRLVDDSALIIWSRIHCWWTSLVITTAQRIELMWI